MCCFQVQHVQTMKIYRYTSNLSKAYPLRKTKASNQGPTIKTKKINNETTKNYSDKPLDLKTT